MKGNKQKQTIDSERAADFGAPRDISPKKHGRKLPPPTVHIDSRSFLALLIRSFVSFMLISVIGVVLIFVLAMWLSDNDMLYAGNRDISSYSDKLEKGNFDSVPVKRLYGKDGWLCIVNVIGEQIYSSDGNGHSYTLSELACIQDLGSGATISSRSYKMSDGKYHHLITRTSKAGEDEQYLILDENLNIISGSIQTDKKQFTRSELDLYTYNSSHGGKIIEKYRFSFDGNDCYAVYYDVNNRNVVAPYLFVIISTVGIIAMMVASLILYIRYINKHVQRPLKALGNAMTDFAQNNYRATLTYSGTKEFEQLVDSFNEMVALLNASEKHRIELEQDRERMLAGLSHDLKTPITIIQGFSKAIRDGLVSEEDKQKYLNLIISKSENMGALVSEFYEYSKLDHPDFKLNLETVDVAELARTFLAERYDEFEIAGYSLEADIPDGSMICSADKRQLTRVFENLTNNFFKYTAAGSTLCIRATTTDDEILISFADNGGGIDESMYDDIFEPFVVAEQSRSKQGSGLGLAVCKRIITAHGGTISLNRTPMDGYKTQFDVILPKYQPN